MAADVTKYYVHKGDKTIAEGMTKEQILTAIQQAVEQGEITDVDTGFVTSLKEQNGGQPFKVWIGTEAQYQAIETPERNVLYLITDDGTSDDLEEQIENLNSDVDELEKVMPRLQASIRANSRLSNTTDPLILRGNDSIDFILPRNPRAPFAIAAYSIVTEGETQGEWGGTLDAIIDFVDDVPTIISNTFPSNRFDITFSGNYCTVTTKNSYGINTTIAGSYL